MTDREINLHPKNNPSVNLKPNIVHGNIPEKAVSFKQLDENIQNKIDSQSFQIAKNTADISSLREKIDDEASTREDEDSRVRDEMTEYADHIKSDLEEKISTNKTDIAKNTNNVASILTLIDIDNAKINPSTLENSIDGSDDVIVDVNNDKLAIHLSDELQNTISTHTSTIATNTADITKNTEDITKNTEDIEKKQDTITSSTDLTVNSLTVKMENYIYPAGIEPSEGDITISKDNINENFREVYSFRYGHWRISNGKLSIIVCPFLYNATDTDFSHDFDWLGGSDYIILPQSVADKLIVIAPGGQNIISAGSVETQGIHSDGVAYAFDQRKLMYKIMKIGNTIRVQFDLSKYEPLKIAAGTKYAFRLEENFIL